MLCVDLQGLVNYNLVYVLLPSYFFTLTKTNAEIFSMYLCL